MVPHSEYLSLCLRNVPELTLPSLYAKAGYQYYSNCYIAGATDYIFGDASAWFGECTIASKAGGVITASSRETEDDTSWYVIDHSTVRANSLDINPSCMMDRGRGIGFHTNPLR